MQFFRIPTERNMQNAKIRNEKEGTCRRKKDEMLIKQRIDWLKACERSSKSLSTAPDVANYQRMCILYFYPSVLTTSDGAKHSLKKGTTPTMNLTRSLILNEEFKEANSLPMFVVSQEDIQFVELHEAEKSLPVKKNYQNPLMKLPHKMIHQKCHN